MDREEEDKDGKLQKRERNMEKHQNLKSEEILREKIEEREEFQIPLRVTGGEWAETEGYINQKLALEAQDEFNAGIEFAEEQQTFTWIRNPVTRTYTHRMNSELEVVRIDKVQHLPKVTGPKTHPNAPMLVLELDDTSQRNPDIPSNESFVDMGIELPKELKYDMDKAHFTECCIVRGQNLLAFYEKNWMDYQKPFYRREEWLMEQLDGCTYKEANTFSDTIEKLSLQKPDVLKLMNGYYNVKTDKYRKGLKDRKSWRKVTGRYNNIASEMQELKQNQVHSGETNADPEEARDIKFTGCGEYSLYNSLPESYLQSIGELMIAEEDQDESPDERDDLDKFDKFSDTVFGMHPLYHEAEAVGNELLNFIRLGTKQQVNMIIKCMFPQKNEETGYMRKAVYGHLKPSQKSQVWRYIKDRQAELNASVEVNLKF